MFEQLPTISEICEENEKIENNICPDFDDDCKDVKDPKVCFDGWVSKHGECDPAIGYCPMCGGCR